MGSASQYQHTDETPPCRAQQPRGLVLPTRRRTTTKVAALLSLCAAASIAIAQGGSTSAEPLYVKRVKTGLEVLGKLENATNAGEGAIDAYKKSRQLPSTAAIENERLKKHVVQYQVDLAKTGVERQGYQAFAAVRDLGLSFGGGVGNGLSFAFKQSADRFVLGRLQKVEDASRAAFKASIQKMTDAEYSAFKKNPKASYKHLAEFEKELVEASKALSASGVGESSKADAAELMVQVVEMGQRLGAETYDQMRAAVADTAALRKEVKEQAADLVSMRSQIKTLETMSTQQYRNLAEGVEELRMAQMDGATRAEYLKTNAQRLGELYDEVTLAQMQYKADATAAKEKIDKGFATALAVTNGLSFLAEKVFKDPGAAKAFNDVGKAIQVGQVAFAVFSAFSTGGLSAALGGFQAMGSLGSIFGGGEDANAQQFAEISARLDAIDRKLDELLEMQRKTLAAIERVSHQVYDLQRSLDTFAMIYAFNAELGAKAAWNGYFGTCLQGVVNQKSFVLRERTPEGASVTRAAPLGELTELQWQQLQIVTQDRLRHLLTRRWGDESVGGKCFGGMQGLLLQPSQLAQFLPHPLQSASPGDIATYRRRHVERTEWVRGFVGGVSSKSSLPLLAVPVVNVAQARASWPPYGALVKADELKDLPCWWLAIRPLERPCGTWDAPSTDALGLIDGPPLPVAEVLRLADATLAFYPVAGYLKFPLSGPYDPVTLAKRLSATAPDVLEAQRSVLENALRLVDATAVQVALRDGVGVAPALSEHVLGVSSTKVPEQFDRASCANLAQASQTYPHDGVAGAEVREYLDRDPELARAALRFALHRIVFPETPFRTDTSRALLFKVRRTDAPGFWPNNAYIPRERETDVMAKVWWRQVVQKWQVPVAPVADTDGQSIEMAWDGNLLRFAYAGAAKRKIQVSVIQRMHVDDVAKLDPSPITVCADKTVATERWVIGRELVELPASGWYVGVGRTFLPMPAADELRDMRLGVSPELVNLFQRRQWLLGERLSFEAKYRPPEEILAALRESFRRNALVTFGQSTK